MKLALWRPHGVPTRSPVTTLLLWVHTVEDDLREIVSFSQSAAVWPCQQVQFDSKCFPLSKRLSIVLFTDGGSVTSERSTFLGLGRRTRILYGNFLFTPVWLFNNDAKGKGKSIIGSAEALPILCVRYFRWEREREIQRERERRQWRHHCRAIGDEFTLSLAKNSHNWRWAYTFPCQKFALFVSPFTLPVSPFTERSPLWRWNSQWVHTFHCQKFSPSLFPLFQWHEPHDEWSKTQDKWSNLAQSYFVLPIEKLNQINTKNYWK